jgi:hypothetical protein
VRRLVALVAGALLPAAAGAYYHEVCFGSPFSVGFHHEADPAHPAAYASGFLGLQAPSLRALFGVTLSAQRGVAYLTPVLLLAPLGFARGLRDPRSRAEAVAAAATVVAIGGFAICTVDWTSGWAFCCRYLVPALPFALIGVAAALRDAGPRSPVALAFRGFAAVGLVTVALAAATFPLFPREFEAPVWQLSLPLLLRGYTMPALLGDGRQLVWVAPFLLVVAGAIGFVWLRAWPLRGSIGSVAASALLAGGVLVAMQRAAPPAASDAHQAALALVFRALER